MTDDQIHYIAGRIVDSFYITSDGTDASRLRMSLIRHQVTGPPGEYRRWDRDGFAAYLRTLLKFEIAEVEKWTESPRSQ